jgi:hypothetical protein
MKQYFVTLGMSKISLIQGAWLEYFANTHISQSLLGLGVCMEIGE